jgi:hypothetical protein
MPASAIIPQQRRSQRPTPPPPVSKETHEAARSAVRELLQQSQAFQALDESKRRELAHNLVQIGSYLAEPDGIRLKQQSSPVRALAGDNIPKPEKFGQAVRTGVEQMVAMVQGVNFPGFVAGLIQGVFHSIVESSIEQMEAYGKLVADVAKSLNQFRDDNTTDNQGRDHLIEQFPDMFELSFDGGDGLDSFGSDGNAPPQPRVVLRDGVDEKTAVDRLNRSLPLDKPLTGLDDDTVEAALVPAARTQLATGRQQLLATMVMMGINRIVVTDGKIQAKVMFDFKATDNRKYAMSATQFDHERDASGNLVLTNVGEGTYDSKSQETQQDASYSHGKDSSEYTGGSRDASYYSKGTYKYSQQPVVKAMSTQKLMDDSNLSTKASLVGNVEVNFKSDYLPLEKMATPENIAAIQMNAQPGMVKNLAARPKAGGAPASTAPAASAPAPTPAA